MLALAVEEVLKNIPKPVLILGTIILVLYFWVFHLKPQRTICDAQIARLQEDLKGDIFPIRIKKETYPPKVKRFEQACRQGGSPGACLDYFLALKKLGTYIRNQNRACVSEAFNVQEVRGTVETGIDIMVRVGWGDGAPKTLEEGMGWLSASDRHTYCLLKNVYLKAMGEESWIEFRTRVISKLKNSAPSVGQLSLVGWRCESEGL